jgi:small-conductance mechanosensitive channel
VLLNRFKVSAGGRYTVITLMTYVIVAIGILLALTVMREVTVTAMQLL